MSEPSIPWVLKAGGRELTVGPELDRFVGRVAEFVRSGRAVVVVHGGGDEVTARATSLGLPTERRAGQRITSEAMLEVVLEVLVGRVNTRLVAALNGAGVPAIGVSGVSARLLSVLRAGDPPGSLGLVGDPASVDPRWLRRTLNDGITPVVAPIGLDPSGEPCNVNADLAAGAFAAALGAELLLLTDVPTVRGPTGPIAELSPGAARRLVAEGAATDGMIPKLDAGVRALGAGARSVWIGDLDGLGSQGPRPRAGTRVVPAEGPRARPTSVPLPLLGAV